MTYLTVFDVAEREKKTKRKKEICLVTNWGVTRKDQQELKKGVDVETTTK